MDTQSLSELKTLLDTQMRLNMKLRCLILGHKYDCEYENPDGYGPAFVERKTEEFLADDLSNMTPEQARKAAEMTASMERRFGTRRMTWDCQRCGHDTTLPVGVLP
ncbi:hypothetical protein SAMN05421858_5065 [Haladaptatus litoreus]|uniref:Uncharacterized protein n=1 Tax=Haladaptatus litoreus TaxID=553468 RepID=A0A1N7FHN7_9EURY|nr:hypothetical protein SAMN05421858_5065 [Haladaptatus litoreus]